MIKFLHLIGGTTFFGIIIASFFYITHAILKKDGSLLSYSLKASYFGDALIIFIILFQLYTSIKLVETNHLSLAIPWIFIAFHAFGTVIVLWVGLFFIKKFFLSHKPTSSLALGLFCFLNIVMIVIFMVIIHDAVTQSTWFDVLLRK